MGDLDGFEVGQKVELADGRIGVVQFVGPTTFAEGSWIGLVLDDRSGKNDGTVQGKRYFRCEQGKGMFVRPTGVSSILEQLAAKPTKRQSSAAPPVTSKARAPARTSNIGGAAAAKRPGLADPTERKRSLVNASPTPAGRPATRGQTLRPPSKSPTKQISSRPSSGASSLRTSTLTSSMRPGSTPATRTSIGGRLANSNNASARPSIGGANANGTARALSTTARKPASRLSSLQQGPPSTSASSASHSARSNQLSPTGSQDMEAASSQADEDEDEDEDEDKTILSPRKVNPATQKPSRPSEEQKPPEKVQIAPSQRPSANTAALSRENEDLKTKLRLLDKKCVEYRDKFKALERVQEERDKFEGIIQKLQKKYQPQQQEIADLKKQIKDLEANADANDGNQMDIDTAVEIATLDREMAEEKAEAAKQELEILRQEYEELRLEAEILRDENAELGKEMSPEERTSQGWMQLERSNERLREALVRLRDMTQDTEAELKDQIRELESDVKELTSYKQSYEELHTKHDHAESIVEDLRAQLETAGGADDMIEELTENNMALKEQVDELKTAIEDLENLKELNDELEANHIENEKQMQEEIDYQEALFLEQQRVATQKDESIEELEYTTSRFRELVMNLQSDLEDMRASQQITEIEASNLTNKSKAMMDLNLKLQASATKTQNKAIEVEMGKLEAQEAHDHLGIVQYFLPQTYTAHKDSVDAYLRVKRISFKSRLLHTFVRDRANGVALPEHEDEVFAACDALDKLTWVSAMCDRLSNFVQRSSLESFRKFADAMYDLEPVERAFNAWIEGLKRDDFKDRQCAAELGRSISLMTHLAEAHIPEELEEYADDVYMRALVMQSHLESSASVIAQVKAITQVKLILPTDADEEDEAEAEAFLAKADALVSQLRSAKVIAGKAVHQVSDLKSRSLTLDPSTSDQIEQFQLALREYVAACQSASSAFLSLVNEDGRADSLTYSEVTHALDPSDSIPFSTLTMKLRSVMDQIQSWQGLTSSLSQTAEITHSAPTPPWKLLSDQIRADMSVSAEQEREVSRLKDELAERNTTVAMKDKALEELNVNVEVLNKRVTESQGRREHLRDLQTQVQDFSRREQEATAKLGRAQEDLERLEAERESWSKRPRAVDGAIENAAGATQMTSPSAIAAQREMLGPKAAMDITILKDEIQSLQATIRHLRRSAYQTSLSKDNYSFLSTPLHSRPDSSTASLADFGQEAKDAFKALLDLTSSEKSAVPQISLRSKDQRLSWRPVKQTVRWQVQRQTEEWEAWCEWRNDLARRQKVSNFERMLGRLQLPANEPALTGKAQVKEVPLARLGIHLLGKEWEREPREVKILRPEDWSEIERDFGVA